jgi:hypothetical protein
MSFTHFELLHNITMRDCGSSVVPDQSLNGKQLNVWAHASTQPEADHTATQ